MLKFELFPKHTNTSPTLFLYLRILFSQSKRPFLSQPCAEGGLSTCFLRL